MLPCNNPRFQIHSVLGFDFWQFTFQLPAGHQYQGADDPGPDEHRRLPDPGQGGRPPQQLRRSQRHRVQVSHSNVTLKKKKN